NMGLRITGRRALVIVAVVVAASAAALFATRPWTKAPAAPAGAPGGPPVPLQFGAADLAWLTEAPMARWLPVSGTLTPVHQATVKAKVPGEVKEVRVREGETVRAGQVLVRIDTADLDAKLIERQGALESAKAQMALAEKTRATNVKLLNEKFISQTAFDSSQSGYDVAKGNVKSIEAQVLLARNAIKDATVIAPIAGIVGKRHVQGGEKVAQDAPLVTVVDLSDLELQALVPAIDVPALSAGMSVELAVDGFGERKFAGRIARINPSTEPGTRAIMVYVALRNPDAALRSGMFANGRIALAASAPMATLPATAVRTEGGQCYVWVVDNGKLSRRIVPVGRRDEDAGLVEVKTPLPKDLPVLATRFENLKEGAPALVKAPTPTSEARAAKPKAGAS
ncbi:MAG TPA: efflux RND transporter periplasmic adaptor subunit, partial [Casimicrobiaceae bacterium]|nr:efflux RND transporter periplasmic adaptor subunit [Casimicrobiaceae bacterium]